MIIWLAILIPFICVPISLVFWRRNIVWWECLLPVVVSILLVGGAKILIEKCQTSDTEYWTGYPIEARYYEEWDEWHVETCTRTVTVTNADGSTSTATETYDCSHRDYHGPQWYLIDNNGFETSIDSSFFEQLCREWGMRRFEDLHRSYYTIDGDMYYTQWNRKIETVHPITYAKRWENRIQASHSIYRPPPVDKRTAKVFDYPEVSEGGLFSKGNIFSVPSILSNTTVSGYAAANDRLCIHNALLGKDYKVRVWLLIWGPGGTLDDAMKQEQYWLRGNKNELVICCGLSEGNKVKWAYVFSWTDEEIIKINCREKVLEQSGQPVDLMKIVDWLPSEIQIHWKKKDFHEFDYLTVEPPIGWVIFVYILTMFACAGTTLFAVLNQIDPERKDDVHWRDVECFGRRLTFVNTCGRIQNVARSLATDFRLLCADMRRWIRRR